ncbi:MAG: helix-turn-helix domain-containing protein [Pseudomonadota bacterium]|jgi:transcriptional regulator with XRE-family HTH domain|uniref:helix-turn-helix domain-containing protein n=1 Tax=Marisediminitalea TaxID=2662254 RepID=UPI0020CF63F9|nr:helix-turn-helix transcriptional regulator [Marisediminitalea aggregata]MCP9479111.1 helix-turn-helix domain-containing protein [Marisediminitalea aggregata]MEC8227727.1 helix-turn-helix domain-containing protein [Pseudomonadota bacterium]|tara:strand:- start:3190 stop:3711 length:522 start_codon:yes stop_codon:yes gene_type:complete
MDQSTLNTLGRHLQAMRQAKGLSLSQLAAGAGIAKSNLSRLEQGNGNPTLDTIWRLAMQLNVPFGALVHPLSGSVGEAGVEVKLIDQGKDKPNVDAYWMSIAPGTHRQAEAHATGTQETITLISGSLEAGLLDEATCLSPGQSVTFAADKPHVYQTGKDWATCLITIVYTGNT